MSVEVPSNGNSGFQTALTFLAVHANKGGRKQPDAGTAPHWAAIPANALRAAFLGVLRYLPRSRTPQVPAVPRRAAFLAVLRYLPRSARRPVPGHAALRSS
jgi:hypothetical protein